MKPSKLIVWMIDLQLVCPAPLRLSFPELLSNVLMAYAAEMLQKPRKINDFYLKIIGNPLISLLNILVRFRHAYCGPRPGEWYAQLPEHLQKGLQ